MPLDRIISIARPGSSRLFRYALDDPRGGFTTARVSLKTAVAAGDRLLHLEAVPATSGATAPVIGEAQSGDVVQFADQQYDLTTLANVSDPFAIRFGRVPWIVSVLGTLVPTFAMRVYGSRAASVLGTGQTWVLGDPTVGLEPREFTEFLDFSSAWWTSVVVSLPQGDREFNFQKPIVTVPHYDRLGPFQALTVGDQSLVVTELLSGEFRPTNGIFDALDIGSEDFPADTPFSGQLRFQVPPGNPASDTTIEAAAILRTPVTEGAPAGAAVTFVSSSDAPKIWAQQLSFRTTQDVTLTADDQALEVDEQVSEWRISARQSVGIDTASVMIDDGGHVWDIRGIDQENDVRYARLFCQRTL